MTPRPRILVIDDVLGEARGGRNRIREDFCVRLGLNDVSGDVACEAVADPVADVVFLSGQKTEQGVVENDIEGTLERIAEGWGSSTRWALVLLDLHFKTGRLDDSGRASGRASDRDPDSYFGLRLLSDIRRDPAMSGLPVTVLSSMDRRQVEKLFADLDVFDFADKKSVDREWLQNQLFHYGLVPDPDNQIIGQSLSLLMCLREARRRSRLRDENILLVGETGVGKDLMSRYIHAQSGRAGPLVTLFTQGVPETLIEDRLFGHTKGAFHGADSAEPGAAERADGGTLFIDEFGNIPFSVQTKLLRLLDRNVRETQRLGSQESKRLDLLVVMATNRLDLVDTEDFRSDLLARAKVRNHTILVPPLRERGDDIPKLAEYFVRRTEQQQNAEHREISREAMDTLESHDWPENVRELEAVLEEAITRYPGLRLLAAGHLKLPKPAGDPLAPPTSSIPDPSRSEETPQNEKPTSAPPTFDEIESLLELCDPSRFPAEDLRGWLPRLEQAYHRLLLRYLNAAFEANRFLTGKRQGEVNRQAAVQLITGENLTGSDTARLVKRLMKRSPTKEKERGNA